MHRPENLTVINYCDASYATEKILRRSVSGMICTVGGLVVNWSSRTQKTTTLSSTENGIIYEDNEGVIFLVKNQQVGMRTKHIDVKYHFVRELVGRGYLDVQYVQSEGNYTDLTTKNVGYEIFDRMFTNGVQIENIVTRRANVGHTGTGLNSDTGSVVRYFTYNVPDKESTGEESVENMIHG